MAPWYAARRTSSACCAPRQQNSFHRKFGEEGADTLECAQVGLNFAWSGLFLKALAWIGSIPQVPSTLHAQPSDQLDELREILE